MIVITLYKQPQHTRKPLELCISCNTRSSVQAFLPTTRTYETQRAPCTCKNVQSEESWLLRYYNTLTKQTFSRTMSIRHIRSILLEIEEAAKMMTKEYILAHLIGTSFGVLQPLFKFAFPPAQKGDFNPDMGTSYATACLRASDESSKLPLLPKTLPEKISRIIYVQQPHTREVKSWYTVTPKPETVRHYHGPVVENGTSEQDWDWQPLFDIESSRLNKERINHHSACLFSHMEVCNERRLAAEEEERQAIKINDHIHMMYEDCRCVSITHIHAYALIYTHMHSYTLIYTHMHSYALICTHIHSYTLICTHMHSYALLYTHIHSYALIYTHIHSYTRMYTHIQIYTYPTSLSPYVPSSHYSPPTIHTPIHTPIHT